MRGNTVERTKSAADEDYIDLQVNGRTVKIASRPAEGNHGRRLFELGPRPKWADKKLLTDDDVAMVVRRLITDAKKEGQLLEIVGVPPGAAVSFPGDPRISVTPVESFSFSLPGTPAGLSVTMDERGDGHLSALGEDRVELGSDGMWWIMTRLIEALEEPELTGCWPRFLVLGSTMGGPATQASLEVSGRDIRIIWRRLASGLVGDVIAVQELSRERANGWLAALRPVRDQLERQRVHRQRMRPAKIAEKWAHALERWGH
jgi:hypothetical protein